MYLLKLIPLTQSSFFWSNKILTQILPTLFFRLCKELDRTPLMLAIEKSAGEDVVKLLLSAGADVNTANTRGKTPLMFAMTSKSGPV